MHQESLEGGSGWRGEGTCGLGERAEGTGGTRGPPPVQLLLQDGGSLAEDGDLGLERPDGVFVFLPGEGRGGEGRGSPYCTYKLCQRVQCITKCKLVFAVT